MKNYSSSKLVFDDTLPYVDERRFTECDWKEFYPDVAEAIPNDAPHVKGMPVSMYCFYDTDHVGCKQTRRSHTDVIIFINRAPILWFSKRQILLRRRRSVAKLLRFELRLSCHCRRVLAVVGRVPVLVSWQCRFRERLHLLRLQL